MTKNSGGHLEKWVYSRGGYGWTFIYGLTDTRNTFLIIYHPHIKCREQGLFVKFIYQLTFSHLRRDILFSLHTCSPPVHSAANEYLAFLDLGVKFGKGVLTFPTLVVVAS